MCQRVFLLFLVKTGFVKALVSYFFFLSKDIKLKENGQAVGCTGLFVGLLESLFLSRYISYVLAVVGEMNFAHNGQVQKIGSPGPGNQHFDYLEKTVKFLFGLRFI